MRGTLGDGEPVLTAPTPWFEMVGVHSVVEMFMAYQDGMSRCEFTVRSSCCYRSVVVYCLVLSYRKQFVWNQ